MGISDPSLVEKDFFAVRALSVCAGSDSGLFIKKLTNTLFHQTSPSSGNPMECSEIRQRFVRYYQEHGFHLLPRAPMLHPSIPMSFVMSAGLEQVETSLSESDNRSDNKFVLVQDCFRHFDTDAVGTDNTHLSFFEMPGAFVFGENERQNHINDMWKLVTEVLGIDPKRIWVSYFSGDTRAGQKFREDRRTYQAWQNIGIPRDRLVGMGIPHNYWIQGKGIQKKTPLSRKCGPSTELFYDLTPDSPCGKNCRPGCRCGRFVEFSNSLFITHTLDPETNAPKPMDDPFSETVVGTERIAMILQKVMSVFDTTDYHPFIKTIRQFITRKNLPPRLIRESECIIADHLKALCKLVADGAPPPGKNGRERIVKLLIRRIETRKILLGITAQNFPLSLIHLLVKTNGDKPVMNIQERTEEYFGRESPRFYKTIERGEHKLEMMLGKNRGKPLSCSQILELEKEWGLPHLVVSLMLHEKGLSFPDAAYKEALNAWNKSAK